MISEINVSVIIATYKRLSLAFSLAKQIRDYHPEIEIIIVNQITEQVAKVEGLPTAGRQTSQPRLTVARNEVSTGGRETSARIWKSNFKYIQLEKANLSRARNKGIKESRGEVIIFFDDDVEITKDTIRQHLKAYNNPSIVGVAGRVICDDDKIPKNSRVDTGKTNFLATKFYQKFWSTKKQFVDFPYGCNMSFRKKVLQKVNGFDEKFPKIFEEIDLAKRVKKFGEIVFLPEALIYHHKATLGGIRSAENNRNKLLFENFGYYMAKNVLFPLSLFSLLLRTITAFKKSLSAVQNLYKGYVNFFKSQLTKFNVLVLFTFLIILFLRLWKVPELFNFGLGEEIQATMAWEQVKNFHPIWIGVSAANLKYNYGPGFTYLNALLFHISRGDPAILAYFSAVLGIATVFSIYYVVKNLFSIKLALFSALFYGASTLINYHDRRFWTPTPVPFITIWFIYSLIKANKDARWLILTSIFIGLLFHLHLSLFLFLLPTLIVVIQNFKKIKIKTWIIMITIYVILTSPLIVFDFVHNYDNILMPYRILTGQNKELSTLNISNTLNHVKETFSTLGRIWFIKLYTNPQDEIVLESHMNKTQGNIFLSILSLIALFWFFLKNRKPGYKLFFLSLLIIPLSYILYPSYNPEYYLMSFITLMTIVIGFWLSSLPNIVSGVILGLFVITNFFAIITSTDQYGLTIKKQLVKQTMTAIKNQSFYLEETGSLTKRYYPYAGWRYLFKAYGKTPNQSSADDYLGWLYPDELTKEKPLLKIIIADTILLPKTKNLIKVFHAGIYASYVYENQ